MLINILLFAKPSKNKQQSNVTLFDIPKDQNYVNILYILIQFKFLNLYSISFFLFIIFCQVTNNPQLSMNLGNLNFLYLQINVHMLQNLSLQKNYNQQFIIPPLQNNQLINYQTRLVSYNILSQNSSNTQYKSQSIKNIIIKAKLQKVQQISLSDEQTTKIHKKCSQKETRNIKSNLLRIFFKYLIELRRYDNTINAIKLKAKQQFDNKDFYKWILSFKINFKNYIRQSQIKKFFENKQPEVFRKVLIILIHEYSNKIGILHCATSRRIQRKSIKLHLSGLRSLIQDL